MTEKSVYLDHAGAALPSGSQIEAVAGDLRSNLLANPHSSHTSSRLTHELVERARIRFRSSFFHFCRIWLSSRVLSHFHVTSDQYQVVFTSGATSALRIVADCFDFGVRSSDCVAAFSDGLPLGAQTFAYLSDSHTSVVGMREIVRQRCRTIGCLQAEQLEEAVVPCANTSVGHDKSTASLFVLTGQSNFSGRKYPLKWIENIRHGCLGSLT
jgi:molybdenum cofactor sulfurtransferase